MKELRMEDCAEVAGGIHIPKLSNLFSSVIFGALGGALTGIVGGPFGMFAGAIAGASMAGAAVATYDAFEIRDSLKNGG